jgi:hypothetical protein
VALLHWGTDSIGLVLSSPQREREREREKSSHEQTEKPSRFHFASYNSLFKSVYMFIKRKRFSINIRSLYAILISCLYLEVLGTARFD